MTDWPDKDYASDHSVRKRKERIKKRRRSRKNMVNQSKGFIIKGDKEGIQKFQEYNG